MFMYIDITFKYKHNYKSRGKFITLSCCPHWANPADPADPADRTNVFVFDECRNWITSGWYPSSVW